MLIMTVLLIIIFLIIAFVPSDALQKAEPCKGHKWSYWQDGRMRCDNCKKTPFED
jgi:hypothetical protein